MKLRTKFNIILFCAWLFTILGLAFLLQIASAATALTFSWQANDPVENVTGYKLYQDGGSPDHVVMTINDPVATGCIYTLEDDTHLHTFLLSAYRESDGEESPLSASQTFKPKPKSISITGTFTLVHE